ncbi:MAG: tripartite tricarboxylate transporter substrate binding protein [Betaproteobacteria bacterium]|nr:tripartite tricarboxylate transporter substrate binding protein [Betaproteobacteria bacterium]
MSVRWLQFGAVAMMAWLSAPLLAQDARQYPTRPIRFIVPLPPGGGTDLLARTIAPKLGEKWGQTVVVDNRAGASGAIGLDLAAKAVPDGYTIVAGYIAPMSINVSLTKLPYDPVTDFAPVTLTVLTQNVLVVHPSVPAVTVKELIALLKSKPGHYHYASTGSGSSPHLSAELFKIRTGVNMNHVPYRGAGPALIDLIAGQVALYFAGVSSALPHVQAGKLRALAATGSRRSPAMPELPTVAEAGVPGYESIQWHGVLAPAKTPVWILDKLNRDFVAVLNQPELKERLLTMGFEVVASSREQFASYIKEEIAKWAKVIKEAGIRAD